MLFITIRRYCWSIICRSPHIYKIFTRLLLIRIYLSSIDNIISYRSIPVHRKVKSLIICCKIQSKFKIRHTTSCINPIIIIKNAIFICIYIHKISHTSTWYKFLILCKFLFRIYNSVCRHNKESTSLISFLYSSNIITSTINRFSFWEEIKRVLTGHWGYLILILCKCSCQAIIYPMNFISMSEW